MTYCPNNNYFILLGMDKEQLIAYIEDLQDEIEEFKRDDYVSQDEYDEVEDERDELLDVIDDLECEIDDLKTQISDLQEELDGYKGLTS